MNPNAIYSLALKNRLSYALWQELPSGFLLQFRFGVKLLLLRAGRFHSLSSSAVGVLIGSAVGSCSSCSLLSTSRGS
ncbi:MAG: hypothetical protein ACKO45_12130 [Cyanobium sp.]